MWKLLAWLVVSKAIVLLAVCVSGIGLFPDEAQYWTWSQALSYAYYSKPLGIAYEIATGTALFGNTEFGVRFGALVLSFLLPIAIYALGRGAGLRAGMARAAAVLFALAPIGLVSTFLATTDCGFLLLWSCAAAIYARDCLEGKPGRWLFIGVCIAIGALFKWAVYLLWLPMIGYALWRRRERWAQLIGGIVISLIGLLPGLIWSSTHHWATFRHVGRSLVEHGHGNVLPWLGAQLGLISPLLWILAIVALVLIGLQLKKMPQSLVFCWWTSVVSLGIVVLLSCFRKVQGNWSLFAYPTTFVLLMAICQERPRFRKWAYAGGVLSVLLMAPLLFLPYLQSNDITALPYKLNPWRAGLGWDRLRTGLATCGYDPQDQFLFADTYQMASIASFYSPEQRRAYFLNLRAIRRNQFSYWPQLWEKEVGHTGWYVGIIDGQDAMTHAYERHQYMVRVLSRYFRTISAPATFIPLYEDINGVHKVAFLIRCENYNGKKPPCGISRY